MHLTGRECGLKSMLAVCVGGGVRWVLGAAFLCVSGWRESNRDPFADLIFTCQPSCIVDTVNA